MIYDPFKKLFVCFSISALQWLCNADKRTHSPPKRLYTFFSTLYSCLVRFYHSNIQEAYFLMKTFSNLFLLFQSRGSRAVFQLYPENSEQVKGEKPLCISMKAPEGFSSLTYHLPLFSSKLELITTQAMKAGFSGGMVVDYPNSAKAKKSVFPGSGSFLF